MRSDDPRASVAACNSLLDRGYGKAVAPIEMGNAGEFDHLSDLTAEQMKAELINSMSELGFDVVKRAK